MGPGALFQLGLLSLSQWHHWRASLQLSDSCACSGPLTLLAWIPTGHPASQPDLRSSLSPRTCLTVTELCLTPLIPTRPDHVLWIDSMACPQICLHYKLTWWFGVLIEPGHHSESALQGHGGTWVAGVLPSWPYRSQLLASRQPLLFLTLYFHWHLTPCASGKNLCLLTSLSGIYKHW